MPAEKKTLPPRLDVAAALAHLRRVQPELAPLIDRHGAPPLQPSRDHFQALARSIVSQQLSGVVVRRIAERLGALAGGRRFPSPPALLELSDEALRGAGLSRQKIAALRDLAAHFVDGRLSARALVGRSEEEIAALLTQVRGVGAWTVDMFLIFALNRPDVLPVGDLGIRKGFRELFRMKRLPHPRTMRRLANPWRPHRSVASWYLWRIAEGGLPPQ
jgi:DNA-3-methyladenine glycosylase II